MRVVVGTVAVCLCVRLTSAQPGPDPVPAPDPATDPVAAPAPTPAPPPQVPAPTQSDQLQAPPDNPDFLPSLPVAVAPPPKPPPKPRRFPYELADRPLVLPDGITELELSFEYRRFFYRDNGERKVGTTRTPDINIEHSFGRLNLGAGIGQLGYGWIGIDTGALPRRIRVDVSTTAPQANNTYSRTESATVSHKIHFAPGIAAWIVNGGFSISQFGTLDEYNQVIDEHQFSLGMSTGLELQITKRFEFGIGGGVGIPVASTMNELPGARLNAAAELVHAFESWDLALTGAANNLTRDIGVYVSLGIAKRWGL